jgi:integrase/recombinase XerD
MKLQLLYQRTSPPGLSPYRLIDQRKREIPWLNEFLDAQRARGLSLRSVRAYAYDLLHFARWWLPHPPRPFAQIDESTLLDYLRYQRDHHPEPAPQTLYHRLSVLRCLYRFHYGREIPRRDGSPPTSSPRSPFGYGGPRRSAISGLGLKRPRRLIVPLSADEVGHFWRSFRTFRDLSLIALMLHSGLRSQEVLAIQLEDLHLIQAQLRVHGKGNKERLLPLSPDTIQALERYLHLERPLTNSPSLFVSLKPPRRGQPMTSAGLRSLFRHHRGQSKIRQANPHRFRHTFGADMVRAGISLPALMRLMGHSHIHTTMLYVQLSPQDVWDQFHRALENLPKLPPSNHET